MDTRIFVGTASGLWTLEGATSRPVEALTGRSVTALALGPASAWSVVDGAASWAPTVDIERDVHQVLAHPTRAEVVMVAAADGFGLSRDGGDSWHFATAGLHAHYLRAVAMAGDHVLVSASTGFRGRRSAIYRKRLDGGRRFERCSEGLPPWFDDNVDTGCLAAA